MKIPVTVDLAGGPGVRRHYGWVVLAVTFTTILVGAGVRYGSGVLIRPLEVEFGWDRASVSLAIAIGIFIFGLTGPIAGTLLDRFGPRLVMALGTGLTVVGLGLIVQMQELWQLYVFWGLLTGVGTGALSGSLGATVAARWFKTRRGMVIGLFSAAVSMGQLVFVPILLGITVVAGWRGAVILLAAAGIGLLIPITVLMRDRPSDKGLLPMGDNGSQPTAAEHREETRRTPMREVLRGRNFWLLAGSLFICGYTTTGLVTTHLIPFSLEHGFDEAITASSMGLMGAMNIVGSLASGWLTDRFDNRRLLASYYFFRALSLLALPFVLNAPQLLIFSVVYGLDWIATAPPTSNLTVNIYGKASLGQVYGWIFFAHMLGASIAAYAGGYLHEALGGYNVVFLSAALMGFIAAGFALSIRAPGGTGRRDS